jgi:sorbitol-6-phosphate 2-dehydrogenase
MERETESFASATVRGLSVPLDADGKPSGVPAFVLAGRALQGEGTLSIGASDRTGFAAASAKALETWRSDNNLASAHFPSCIEGTVDSKAFAFHLGPDPATARSRAGASASIAWEARTWPPSDGLSAQGRDRVVEGRIALVTGGAQGFGEEISRGLAASGAYVWIADLNYEGASRLAATINEAARRELAFPLSMDVRDEASCDAAFARVCAEGGGLDLCVSNAGVLKAGSVLEQSAADFRFVADVNYVGFFLVARRAAAIMRAQRAACPGWRTDIIQINSKSGLEGSNKNGAYAGSKFGGIGLVQSFALELVEFGIKVNAICPGNFFDGPLWSDPEKGLFAQYLRTGKVPGATTVEEVRAAYEARVPMGRGCSGPDVMRAIYYAVEQEYETGQAIPATGGQVMLN